MDEPERPPIEDIARQIADVEHELGLPTGFFRRLGREDDWSFVVKAHAVIEAAVTHQLVAAVNDTRLKSVFASLELSNNATGKLAFAKALNLLTDKQRMFIKSFSELRNDLVHDITKAAFTFPTHIEQLDHNQRKHFIKAFNYFALDQGEPVQTMWRERLLTRTKFTVLFGVLYLVSELYLYSKRAQLERQIEHLETKQEMLGGLFEDAP